MSENKSEKESIELTTVYNICMLIKNRFIYITVLQLYTST